MKRDETPVERAALEGVIAYELFALSTGLVPTITHMVRTLAGRSWAARLALMGLWGGVIVLGTDHFFSKD